MIGPFWTKFYFVLGPNIRWAFHRTIGPLVIFFFVPLFSGRRNSSYYTEFNLATRYESNQTRYEMTKTFYEKKTRYEMTKVGTKWLVYELTFKSHIVPSWTGYEMTKVGTKWPGYEMVVTGYEMTKKWVRSDQNGSKLRLILHTPGPEIRPYVHMFWYPVRPSYHLVLSAYSSGHTAQLSLLNSSSSSK